MPGSTGAQPIPWRAPRAQQPPAREATLPSVRREPHRFDVDELLNAEPVQLAAISRPADAAKRQAWIRVGHAIDEDAPGLEPVGHPDATAGVPRPHVATETELAVVRHFDRLTLVTHSRHRGERAERLRGEARHADIAAGEHGRLEEAPAAPRASRPGARLGPARHALPQ